MRHSLASRIRRFRWAAAAVLVATDRAAGGAPSTDPDYVGPQPCPDDPSILGYDNTTTLLRDMFLIGNDVFAGKLDRDEAERVYTLCPRTIFHLGRNLTSDDPQRMAPLVPFLENTVVRCGESGALENECVLRGGFHHIFFEDDFDWLENVTFAGLRFEMSESVSVFALGHPITDMKFVNCKWKFNSVGDFIVLVAWDKDFEVGFERDTKRSLASVSKGQHLSLLKNVPHPRPIERRQLHDTIEGAMYTEFVNCKFENNEAKHMVILNQGGKLDLNGCSFEKNKADVVVASISNSTLSIHGGTSFHQNEDLVGPVFLSSSSALPRYDEDTTGDDNIGTKGCQGVFIQAQGAACNLSNPSACDGYCCEFGNTSCVRDQPPSSKKTAASESSSTDSSGRKCGAFCKALAVIVPVCVVFVVALACSAYRTRQQVASMSQTAGEGGEGCELEAPKTERRGSVENEAYFA